MCESRKGAEWLANQSANLLPVPHHLVTFALPWELRPLAYRHQKAIYNLLFRAAAEALQALAGDPRFAGGQIGMIGVLHTATLSIATCSIILMCISWCPAEGWTGWPFPTNAWPVLRRAR